MRILMMRKTAKDNVSIGVQYDKSNDIIATSKTREIYKKQIYYDPQNMEVLTRLNEISDSLRMPQPSGAHHH